MGYKLGKKETIQKLGKKGFIWIWEERKYGTYYVIIIWNVDAKINKNQIHI